jgi:hypothetical protein
MTLSREDVPLAAQPWKYKSIASGCTAREFLKESRPNITLSENPVVG